VKQIILLISLSIFLFSADSIDTIKIASSLSQLNSFKFETPHGSKVQIPQNSELIIIAFEKDTGRLVNKYLKTKDSHYLTEAHAIYIADIHEMPSIIISLFALPKLKKYEHPIFLYYDDDFQTIIPNKDGKVTLIYIKNKKVTGISFISTQEELTEAIEK